MNLQLQDRVALVTGASEGIGAGMVRVFAAQGVTVVATARREDRLLALADEIAKSGGIRPYVIAADITDAGALDSLLAQVQQRFGTIDIVINAVAGSSNRTERRRRGLGRGFCPEFHAGASGHPRTAARYAGAGMGPDHQHQRLDGAA